MMTTAWCAILDIHDHWGVGGNACVLLPEAVAERVRQGLELGDAMDWLTQRHDTKHQNGAIGILTDDLETRQSAYETIVRMALAPFRRPQWYYFDRIPDP